MKAHSRNHMEWLGQARDPIWTAMARKKNNAIMRKYAKKGSASVELLCFILVTLLFVGLSLWLLKVAFESGVTSGVWIGRLI